MAGIPITTLDKLEDALEELKELDISDEDLAALLEQGGVREAHLEWFLDLPWELYG